MLYDNSVVLLVHISEKMLPFYCFTVYTKCYLFTVYCYLFLVQPFFVIKGLPAFLPTISRTGRLSSAGDGMQNDKLCLACELFNMKMGLPGHEKKELV